jgi:hypothetical protein
MLRRVSHSPRRGELFPTASGIAKVSYSFFITTFLSCFIENVFVGFLDMARFARQGNTIHYIIISSTESHIPPEGGNYLRPQAELRGNYLRPQAELRGNYPRPQAELRGNCFISSRHFDVLLVF